VLGVCPTASLDEIHDAYRAQSKKYHPDRGGDEWAFRMVARAYEVLKTTSNTSVAHAWESAVVNRSSVRPRRSWTWTGAMPFGGADAPFSFGDYPAGPGGATRSCSEERGEGQGTNADEPPNQETTVGLEEFRTVDVELIWTRLEMDALKRVPSPQEEHDATLSVCMVISWPAEHLVEQAAQVDGTGEILHNLIDLFERLREQRSVVLARSRIEDGRFVGWLSYPDVLAAQDAFLNICATFDRQELTARLQTRDERIPFDWSRNPVQPVGSRAS
jgi:hypothetical protein